jgi:hypothetical protein
MYGTYEAAVIHGEGCRAAVRPILKAIPAAALFMTCAMLIPATHAAEIGSLPNAYSPGATIGVPEGVAPPPGVYWQQTSADANLLQVNGKGAATGNYTNSYFSVATFLASTNYHLFGGRYSALVTNVGIYQVNLHEANGDRPTTTSWGDIEIDPIRLSWGLTNHLFVSLAEGVNPPTGSFEKSRIVNVGHNRVVFDQHVNISYLTKQYMLTANGTINVNTPNVATNFTSGSTYDVDLTALRRFGNFQTGPVGYYFRQFGSDTGSQSLNGGMPTEGGIGWLVGYNLDGWQLNAFVTQDVYARSFASQTKVWFTVAHRLL